MSESARIVTQCLECVTLFRLDTLLLKISAQLYIHRAKYQQLKLPTRRCLLPSSLNLYFHLLSSLEDPVHSLEYCDMETHCEVTIV
jgi:hypothetical protein